jgi:hypothetical protein
MNRFGQSPAAAQSSSTRTSIATQLVGVWRLVSYRDEQEGGEDSFPFGPEPEGFLIYTPEGFVSAQLMKPGRFPFQSQDWHGGTPDEYRQAGSGYIAYCGVYEVDEEKATVTHIPSVALLPNLILKGQQRSVTLNGDRLTLCAAGIPVMNGVPVTTRLVWQRARAGEKRDRVVGDCGVGHYSRKVGQHPETAAPATVPQNAPPAEAAPHNQFTRRSTALWFRTGSYSQAVGTARGPQISAAFSRRDFFVSSAPVSSTPRSTASTSSFPSNQSR